MDDTLQRKEVHLAALGSARMLEARIASAHGKVIGLVRDLTEVLAIPNNAARDDRAHRILSDLEELAHKVDGL